MVSNQANLQKTVSSNERNKNESVTLQFIFDCYIYFCLFVYKTTLMGTLSTKLSLRLIRCTAIRSDVLPSGLSAAWGTIKQKEAPSLGMGPPPSDSPRSSLKNRLTVSPSCPPLNFCYKMRTYCDELYMCETYNFYRLSDFPYSSAWWINRYITRQSVMFATFVDNIIPFELNEDTKKHKNIKTLFILC